MARSLSGTDESAGSFDKNKLITQTILHSGFLTCVMHETGNSMGHLEGILHVNQ